MPELVVPTAAVHRSFLDAMREFADEGRGAEDDDTMFGADLRALGDRWREPDVFASYVEQLLAEADAGAPRPAGRVACTTLWWVEGDTFLGRIAIRHRLTDRLREVGGHIGYDVRRSARRRGHATQMLRRALPIAARLGIERALVTCSADNVASRRVIESNGGVLEDCRDDKLRFWVPTSPCPDSG